MSDLKVVGPIAGWKIVPISATEEMADVGACAVGPERRNNSPSEIVREAHGFAMAEYAAMLAASPVFVPSGAQVERLSRIIREKRGYMTAETARAIFAALPQILAEEPAERAAGSGAG
jgi:hypothetical protein